MALGRIVTKLSVIFLLCNFCLADDEKLVPKRCFRSKEERSTPILKDSVEACALGQGESPTILASLLDGSLVAINKVTGTTKWKLLDEPVVKSPYNPAKPLLPAFLPDPKDGALYVMGGSLDDPIKKLPFTIPELVAASPSRTTDGILYSGKKIDTWLSVNRLTGVKQGSLSTEGCQAGDEDMCPASKPGTILIGRTEYNIMMYDTRTKNRRWNITYYDYSSNLGGIDISSDDYELAHFTDSSTGALITLDKTSGAVQWEQQFNSPVVAMYQLASDSLASIPFTSVSVDTLNNLMDRFQSLDQQKEVGETKLFPTLYVGEHEHGLFAVPSLVDEKTRMISPTGREGQLLIEGPENIGPSIDIGLKGKGRATSHSETGHNRDSKQKDKSSLLLFGYYQVPGYSPVAQSPALAPFQLTTSQTLFPFQVNEVQVIEGPEFDPTLSEKEKTEHIGESSQVDNKALTEGLISIKQLNTTFIFSNEMINFFQHQVLPLSRESIQQMENKEMKLVMVVVLLTAIWFVRFVKQQFKKWDRGFNSTHDSNSMSQGSVNSITSYEITASPVELPDGSIKVGNISFDPGQVLGKGCEGTFVYKGRFDNRDVAVKRVLAACFSIADREVDLLRESDEHPHVVRYFCMEQCRQFRYIALELCIATLQDVVEGNKSDISEFVARMDMTKLFRQAVLGLGHLHSLDIAHRDIKPQNVLISVPGKGGEVRAMISDFGLCKKLKVGRMSFSRRSGVAGTEGWIAPEMLLGHRSTTCMVDIFSVGCVYYYLLTKGRHPFGENFHRQANILSGKSDLLLLDKERQNLNISLIEKTLSFEPTDRPPAEALLKHPVFWSADKVLTFLMEVSDRVDKEEEGSAVLASIERYGWLVTKGDWYDLLDHEVREDLRKHRSYRGRSVRDLLRAIRNKKHHYRELTDEAKALYGKMPGEFADYWSNRFPRLVIHSYTAMQCVKYENTFAKYYHKDYDFVQTKVREVEETDHFTPKFMDRIGPVEPLVTAESRDHSLVSNWSQLDSGNLSPLTNSRLEETLEEMQPCLREVEPPTPATPCPDISSQSLANNDLTSNVITLDEPHDLSENLPQENCDKTDNILNHINKDFQVSPVDKENLKPDIVEGTEAKKKNKKRRKHQKKNKKEVVSEDCEKVDQEEATSA